MSARQVLGATFLGTLAVAVPLAIVATIVSQGVVAPRPAQEQWAGVDYGGDPEAEAVLVELEERHLSDVRSTMEAALWDGGGSYRLVSSDTTALVLTARAEPYTLEELVSTAPETVTRQADGSYLLNESVVVLSDATLSIAGADGLVLRMTSTADSFVSIVTLGGSLTVHGTDEHPATVTSWDASSSSVDTSTRDGRAYVRVIGGHADFAFAQFESLGFWSGATGGVALTGNPVPGDQATVDAALSIIPSSMVDPAKPGPPPPPQPTATSTPTRAPHHPRPGSPTTPGGGATAPEEAVQAGPVRTLNLEPDYGDHGRVSATIESAAFTNNAFGLFVSGADEVNIANSTVSGSLVDGLLMFRDVTNSTVTDTTSSNNGADGFSLASSTTSTVLTRVTAAGNGRNGISIEGAPLVDGPSPAGVSTVEYGHNTVVESTASKNGRYGIEVVGGTGVVVDGNTVDGSVTGIVVADGARAVKVTNNTMTGTTAQGIALRDAGTDLIVQGNETRGAAVGIYSRNSGGQIRDNHITGATNHAISLVGATGFSSVIGNTASGTGPSAVDVVRTRNVVVSGNNVAAWEGTKPVDVTLRSLFQPLTVLWIVLGTLVFVTAFLSLGRRRRQRKMQDPRAPLSSYTRGILTREQARALVAARNSHRPPTIGVT